MSENLTQDENGVISIGPKASKASKDRAEKEALENAQKVVEDINAETEKDKPEDTQ